MNGGAKRIRADKALVDLGLADSRTRAQALIMAGTVYIGEQRIDKSGDLVASDANITVRGGDHPWVSRGGMKLDYGLNHFEVDPTNCICIDIGASTGGFTEVLLQKGAATVYAVGGGKGQLDWRIRGRKSVV